MRTSRVGYRYCREVRRALGLWPAWLPDSLLKVGDYGRIFDGLFVRDGHVADVDVEVRTSHPRSTADHFFTSRGVRKVVAGPNVEVLNTNVVKTQIEFGGSFGVLVALRRCVERRISDSMVVSKRLAERVDDRRLPADILVVTGVIESTKGLIAVSSSRHGRLELTTSVSATDLLAQLDGDVNIVVEAELAYRAVLHGGSTPLFRLSRLRRHGDLVMRGRRYQSHVDLEEVDARLSVVDRSIELE
jgi:hypothetical protein